MIEDRPAPPRLRVEGLRFRAGAFSLEADLCCDRWPLVILGPSGSGKTLLLRLLAGLETPARGKIECNGEVWFDCAGGGGRGSGQGRQCLPPFRRSVGFCLQDPLLFPHLSVIENVAYPLESIRPRLGRDRRLDRALEELRRWGAEGLALARVEGLSGGEQGRVALARAFVRRPGLLLLDEPFAALDPPARQDLLAGVIRELRERAAPAVWVTHDRTEAILLGGSTAVFLEGRVAQLDSPEEVFRRPASPGVAAFVGVGTVLHGLVQAREAGVLRLRCGPVTLRAAGSLSPGTPVVLAIRSEDVELVLPTDGPRNPAPEGGRAHASARNELPGTVVSVRPLGLVCAVEVDVGIPLTAAVTRPAVEELGLEAGRPVLARIKAVAVQVRSEAWEGR